MALQCVVANIMTLQCVVANNYGLTSLTKTDSALLPIIMALQCVVVVNMA